MWDILTHLAGNWDDMLAGAFGWALLGHMVNTIPPTPSPWARWLVGGLQFAVGQRDKAKQNGDLSKSGQHRVPLAPEGTGSGAKEQ